MVRIRLTADEINYITLFENRTGVYIKDCILDEDVVAYIVDKDDVSLAVGKGGSSVNDIERRIDKKVYIIPASDDPTQFIRNAFYPIKINRIFTSENDGTKNMTITINKRDRRDVVGHGGERIKIAKKVMERYFGIGNIIIKFL